MSPENQGTHTKMTRFLCQELLYEYASGNLDKNRRRDMDAYLPTCRDSQRELENLKKGLAYAKSFEGIGVTPSLHHGLEGFEPAWKKRLQSMTLWSFQRGWRMLPYAFLAVAAVLGIWVTKPWQKQAQRDLILAEQEHRENTHPEGQGASPEVDKATEIAANGSGAPSLMEHNGVNAPQGMVIEEVEGGETVKTVTQPPPTAQVETPAAKTPPSTPSLSQSASPDKTAAVTPPPPPTFAVPAITTEISIAPIIGLPNSPMAPPKAAEVAKAAADAVAGKDPIQELSSEFSLKEPGKRKAEEARENDEKRDLGPGSGKGSILRGQITVNDFDAGWPAIRDKIISLGGKAAGNVELGWLRREDESYFHFSLPESNYGEFEMFLKTFGPVRISKERHPRVMPEGQIRIILTVKDSGEQTHEDGEAEAP